MPAPIPALLVSDRIGWDWPAIARQVGRSLLSLLSPVTDDQVRRGGFVLVAVTAIGPLWVDAGPSTEHCDDTCPTCAGLLDDAA